MKDLEHEIDQYKYCPQCSAELVSKSIDTETVKACNNCDFIFWNKPKPVVSIILHNDNKVLLLKRSNEPFKEYWVLPGGFISYDEVAEEAITREVEEEVGTSVVLETILGTYKIDDDPRGRHLDIIFAGKITNEVTLNKDNTHFDWFTKETLPEQIAYKHRQAILDWYNKQHD